MDKIINTEQNSWERIIQYYILVIALVTTWYLRQVIFIFLLAFVVAAILERPINVLEKKHLNRWQATSLVYLILVIIGGILVYLSLPSLATYWNSIVQEIPQNIQQLFTSSFSQPHASLSTLLTQLKNVFQGTPYSLGGLIQRFTNVIGGIFHSFSLAGLVLILAFFINGEKDSQEKMIRFFLPHSYQERGVRLWKITRTKVTDWLFAQTILSVFVGTSAYIGFSLIHLPGAGLLAVTAGILDFIPYVGPFLAAALAFISGASQSIAIALLAAAIYFFIQLLENIISPVLRGKVMKMSPLLVIISLIIGGKLAGLGGMIIALPLAAGIKEFIQLKYYKNN